MKSLIKKLNKSYFWDVDRKRLDPNTSYRLIIERVFQLGTVTEVFEVIGYYGKDTTLEVLKGLKHLDPKTLELFSLFFEVPKDQFACYTKRQSRTLPWNS